MKAEVASVQKAVEGHRAGHARSSRSRRTRCSPWARARSSTSSSTLAGGTNVVTEPSYVAYSAEQLIKADPQVYLATKGSMSDPAALAKRAGFAKLAAVKNNRVYILDDNLVSRPGPRVVLGPEADRGGAASGSVSW